MAFCVRSLSYCKRETRRSIPSRSSSIVARTSLDTANCLQAIAHAIDEWKVDIITMSFGWPTRPRSYDRIEEVIDKAIRHKILVFAAASNTGANSAAGPAFPASLERVFLHQFSQRNREKVGFQPYRSWRLEHIHRSGRGCKVGLATTSQQGTIQAGLRHFDSNAHRCRNCCSRSRIRKAAIAEHRVGDGGELAKRVFRHVLRVHAHGK